MSRTTLSFIWAGMLYLLMGMGMGVIFIVMPDSRVLRSVHVHVNLVGFVIFTIFAVAYHILPRFRGTPLYSEALAQVQFYLANLGLLGMLLMMSLKQYYELRWGATIEGGFGALLAFSALLFVYNLGRTLAKPSPPPFIPPSRG